MASEFEQPKWSYHSGLRDVLRFNRNLVGHPHKVKFAEDCGSVEDLVNEGWDNGREQCCGCMHGSHRKVANHLAFSSGPYARGMPNNSKMGRRFPTGACGRTRDERSEGALERGGAPYRTRVDLLSECDVSHGAVQDDRKCTAV